MADWSTTFSGANPVQDPDPVTSAQPNLNDETSPDAGDGDAARTSHPETLRDKVDATARLTGDSVNSPAGSIAHILNRDHSSGDARQVRLAEIAAAPATVAGKHFLYAKTDGKPYVKLGDGTERELGAGGGGTLVDSYFFTVQPQPLAYYASALVMGLHLLFTHTGTVTGARYRSKDTRSVTLRAKLWNGATEVAVGTLATSAEGTYTIPFTTPYEITEAMLGDYFYISVYETGTGYTTRYTSDTYQQGRAFGWISAAADGQCQNYKSGLDDAAPTLVAGTSHWAIDPVFELAMG